MAEERLAENGREKLLGLLRAGDPKNQVTRDLVCQGGGARALRSRR